MNESHGHDLDGAPAILAGLDEETMARAWGERTPEERRRIVHAALIFGEQFDRLMVEAPPGNDEQERQRFLMSLMNAVAGEFARREGMEEGEAVAFLGDAQRRDWILELNEALDAARDSGRPVDDLLREAVEARLERAIRANHWSSG
jgi:hypothetical protein